jgi:hypothetical protein
VSLDARAGRRARLAARLRDAEVLGQEPPPVIAADRGLGLRAVESAVDAGRTRLPAAM